MKTSPAGSREASSELAGMDIRKATEADHERAFAIDAEYQTAHGVVVQDDFDTFRATYFEDGAGFWLLEDNGEAVGCIGLRPLPGVGPQACEVKRLYVRPQYRGQRLADRLLDVLEQFATSYGYEDAYLDTKDDLQTAIRFYHRRGYVDCPRYNDNPQATVFMRRPLGSALDGDQRSG